MGNVNMEASQIHYRGGNRPMSVEEAIKEGSGALDPEVIAPEFSATAQYLEGDLAFYEGKLYRFEVDHDPGAWDSTEVMETNIAENLVMFPGDGLNRTLHTYDVKLQVGGGLAFDGNGALYTNVVHNFSTNEQPTGQNWIDGRPIYFKVVNLSASPVALAHDTWVSTGASATGIDFLIDANVIAIAGDASVCFQHGEVGIINGEIAICMVTSVGARSAQYVTVYYVKPAE